MPGDARQYNTREVLLKKVPEEFRTAEHNSGREGDSNGTTNAESSNGNSNNSSESTIKRDKGHYGHRENDTSHLRSNIAIHDSRRAGNEDDGRYHNNNNNSGSRGPAAAAGRGGHYNSSSTPDSERGVTRGEAGNAARANGVLAVRDRDRDIAREMDGTRDRPTKAVAVYERSYGKPVRPEKVSVRKRHYDHMREYKTSDLQ